MKRHLLPSTLAITMGVFLIGIVSGVQGTDIIAAKPTHYFYTPTASVNPSNHLVLSLHEISYGLGQHLQVQASLFDNIGRINFGAKYGLTDDLAIGAGLASTLASFGHHGIYQGGGRFGAFLCYEFTKTRTFEASVTGHMQLFNHNSIGCDLGLMATPSNVWSIVGETGTSIDFTDHPATFWWNLDGGLRIHPPRIPFLNFDLGIDVMEFPVNVHNASTDVALYLDVIFAMVAR
jgi:hypothetical protein